MVRSSEVKCPICNATMEKMEAIEGSIARLSSLIGMDIEKEEKRYYETIVFKCPECDNLQSFLVDIKSSI